jgi:hypothetical protein
MKVQHKIKPQVIDNGQQKVRYSAIENHLHIQFPMRFELRDRTVGALVLAPNGKGDRFKFVFGFDCKGVHNALTTQQQEKIFDSIESGLKDLPNGETMTIHFGSFSTDDERQRDLQQMMDETQIPQVKFLLSGEKQRIHDLTRQGLRKPKFLRLYVTYTVEPSNLSAADPAEKALGMLQVWWNQMTGQQEEVEQIKWESLFTKAFTDGFQFFEQVLATKMNLQIRPMTEDELCRHVWSRFNQTPMPELPQRVIFSESGIREEVLSEVHFSTLLIESQAACPTADRSWVFVKNRYVGAMTFIDKPAGWANKNDQLRYLWDIFSRDIVHDTEVFCEVSRGNEAILKTNMQRLAKQSIASTDFAESRSSVDVAAQIKTRKTIAAQEQIYEGAVPINVGTVVLVHRKTPDALDEACRYIQSCIRRPALIDRETEYGWLIWLQTLPITWDQLLVKPFNRRMVYLSSEAPGFMPLVRPRESDRMGLELISDEGGVPIFLDPISEHRNVAVFGTTRSGKSVLISAILTQGLASGMPIVALDFPKPDGTSTFTDYTEFMGEHGAYFDIGSESNNLFEIPDLRGMSPKEQKERMQDYTSFLEGALMTMVIGGTAESQMFRNTVRSVLVILLEQFFGDPQIQVRYDTAMSEGFGSEAWQNIPTLHDFLKFCDVGRLDISEIGDLTTQAMGQIKLQLKFWVTSRVGKAISAPSSFRTDARLLVFALRNLADESDAAVLALSAYSAALRRALAAPKSIFFIDESPILFQFDEIAALVGKLCANGAKAGVRVFLSAQDPDTIAKSPSGSKILQNMTIRLVGRIQAVAVASFQKYLFYEPELISRNASESFFPKKEGIYSQWLYDDGMCNSFVRFYPAYPQLAVVANNTDEQACRNEYRDAYPEPNFDWIASFTKAMVFGLRNGVKIPSPDEFKAMSKGKGSGRVKRMTQKRRA